MPKERQQILRKTIKIDQSFLKVDKNAFIKSSYDVLSEHNYVQELNKFNILTNYTDLTDLIVVGNTNNKIDSLPDWLKEYNSSDDEEDDVEDKSVAHLLLMEFQKDSGNSYKVCPPLNWVHLIYLTVKNLPQEYVSCHDVQTFSRNWFPYYMNKSWIHSIISTLNCPSKKYFNYSNTASIGNCVKWTVNIKSVNTLELSLMYIVKHHEKEIKSAMKYPDKLPTILKGYGARYLGSKNVLQRTEK